MSVPPLLGRRIHISGSINSRADVASKQDVELARDFIEQLVKGLLKDGAAFVVPVDREERRDDGLPICFDWLVLKTISDNHTKLRPKAAVQDDRPLITAVQHHKNESQIPDEYREMWEELKSIDGLMNTESAGRWNMNSKRMDLQSRHGDVLIVIGGDEGVSYLANLYSESGKPVVPLNFPVTKESRGALGLWEQALEDDTAEAFFQMADGTRAHNWLNKLNFSQSTSAQKRADDTIQVLRAIRRPQVFAVRLLNKSHEDYLEVENFFFSVVQPVVEQLGFELKAMDGKQNNEPFINQDIFNNLHYSSVVVADLTGLRPNCFIELGYALGHTLPTMMCAREGTSVPFDIDAVPGHRWRSQANSTNAERQAEFRSYWNANINRRPLVQKKSWRP